MDAELGRKQNLCGSLLEAMTWCLNPSVKYYYGATNIHPTFLDWPLKHV